MPTLHKNCSTSNPSVLLAEYVHVFPATFVCWMQACNNACPILVGYLYSFHIIREYSLLTGNEHIVCPGFNYRVATATGVINRIVSLR